MLTIITESAIESVLAKEIENLGAHGYTVSDVRGKGSRGRRNSAWDASGNIRIEVLCDSAVADAIASYLKINYYDNYAMILFVTDVAVLRSEKF